MRQFRLNIVRVPGTTSGDIEILEVIDIEETCEACHGATDTIFHAMTSVAGHALSRHAIWADRIDIEIDCETSVDGGKTWKDSKFCFDHIMPGEWSLIDALIQCRTKEQEDSVWATHYAMNPAPMAKSANMTESEVW